MQKIMNKKNNFNLTSLANAFLNYCTKNWSNKIKKWELLDDFLYKQGGGDAK